MQTEYKAEEREPSYDNLNPTIGKRKESPTPYGIRQIVEKPVFKWTAIAIVLTMLTIIIVVPTVLEVTKQESINGNWGNWTSFSDCSHSCGDGTQYRVWNCDNPSPAFGGTWCEGNKTYTQYCNTDPCPVHGGWGNWSLFSNCSLSCGGGTKTRLRQCDSPSPQYGGNSCSGNGNETRSCNTHVCPVHGNWGGWTDVSGCSHSCDGGMKYRIRMCNSPSPSFGGSWCLGNATEFQNCNAKACPDTCSVQFSKWNRPQTSCVWHTRVSDVVYSQDLFRDYRSAFTIRSPVDGPTSGTIRLTTVISNIGGHYDTSTGQFTCRYPGLYVFFLHIYKQWSYDFADCYIRKNKERAIRAYSNPYGNKIEYTASSNSVIIYLKQGDIVDLGDCSSSSSMYGWTSFSGFLLKPD